MSDRGKLGNFLKEVINWRWDEFVQAESKSEYKAYESAIFSLIRVCSEGKLNAIKTAIDRVDGKVETPIKIETPKVFMLYPSATSVAESPKDMPRKKLKDPNPVKEEPKKKEENALTLTLRETLNKLADQPKVLMSLILERKRTTEEVLANDLDPDDDALDFKIPLVKSVIAANLLHLAIEKNNFEAITEVFDQIDGKLVETFKLLGEDIYLEFYSLEAPAGSVKNEDGIYQIENEQVAETWARKLRPE